MNEVQLRINDAKEKKLESLNLSRLELEVFPEDILNLTHLQHLHLGSNKLNLIPDKINALKNLITLDLSNNEVESLPINIGKLSMLRHLYLTNNKLRMLPPSIGDLSNLFCLYLTNNHTIYEILKPFFYLNKIDFYIKILDYPNFSRGGSALSQSKGEGDIISIFLTGS